MMAHRPGLWVSLRRGMCRRCPNCGRGRLLGGYLKQIDICDFCQESYTGLRADDGPAWLTILIVGHLLAPFIVEMIRNPIMPEWMISTVLVTMAVVLMAVLLPLCKGLFLAAIWWHQKPGAT